MPERILVVRLSSLGDVVQSTPVARGLKSAMPDCHITWAVQTPAVPLLDGNPHIDAIIPVGTRVRARSLLNTWWRLKASEFTTAIDLQGLLKSGIITYASDAPRRIGKEEARESALFAYTELSPERWDQAYISQRYLQQCASLGVDTDDYVPELFLADDDFGPADELLATEHMAGQAPVVVLVPFSAQPRREWPEEHYVRLAEMLTDKLGARIIIPGAEREWSRAEALAQRMNCDATVFAGRTNIRQAAALLQRADLVIGGDTGLTHIAFAVGTPVVGILGPSPLRNGPKGERARTVYIDGIPCRPCRPRQRCDHRRCMTELSSEMVADAALELAAHVGLV